MKPYERTRRVLSSALPAPQRLTLIALMDHLHRDDDVVWPSVTRLGDLTGLGERTVRRALAGLVEAGALTMERSTGRATRYRVCWVGLCHPIPRSESHPGQRVTPVRKSRVPRSESPGGRSERPDPPVRVADEVDKEVVHEVDQGSSSVAAKAATKREREREAWEQARQDLLTRWNRKGVKTWNPDGGLGRELMTLVRQLGVDRCRQLFELAYTSPDFVHKKNRDRGRGGHPPMDTLRRHGRKYLEEAAEQGTATAGRRGAYRGPAKPTRLRTHAEMQAMLAEEAIGDA